MVSIEPTISSSGSNGTGKKRPSFLTHDSFLGRWLAGDAKAPTNIAPTPSKPTGLSAEEEQDRAKLVDRLTQDLTEKSKDTFQLSANEVRLLLQLPEERRKSECQPPALLRISERSNEDSTERTISFPSFSEIPPPPVEPLKPTSSVFDAWDLTCNDELCPEEMQALMLALTAAEEHTDEKIGTLISIPPLAALEKASIRRLNSESTTDTNDYLVTFESTRTFASSMGSLPFASSMESLPEDVEGETESTTEFSAEDAEYILGQIPDPPVAMTSSDMKRFSGGANRLDTKPSVALRQYSIQPFPEGPDPDLVDYRPTLGCRQASVHPVQSKKNSSRRASFVVSLPQTNKKTDSPPTMAKRQVTLQRQNTSSKSIQSASTTATTTTKSRPPMFRMNGKRIGVQVGSLLD